MSLVVIPALPKHFRICEAQKYEHFLPWEAGPNEPYPDDSFKLTKLGDWVSRRKDTKRKTRSTHEPACLRSYLGNKESAIHAPKTSLDYKRRYYTKPWRYKARIGLEHINLISMSEMLLVFSCIEIPSLLRRFTNIWKQKKKKKRFTWKQQRKWHESTFSVYRLIL